MQRSISEEEAIHVQKSKKIYKTCRLDPLPSLLLRRRVLHRMRSGSFYFKELPSFRSGGRHDAAGSLLFSKDPAAALLHGPDVCDRHRDRFRAGTDRFPFWRCIPAFSVLGKTFAASPDPGTPVFSGADPSARRDLSLRTRNLCGDLRDHALHLCDHDEAHLRGRGTRGHSAVSGSSFHGMRPFPGICPRRPSGNFTRISDKRPVSL